jgi:hypothetical protein
MFYRRRNPDGLPPQIVESNDGSGKALRLAVQTDAYTGCLVDEADRQNDRCEIREALDKKTRLGAEVWYGFSVRVPADFPNQPLRCVIAQIKMPYDDGGNGSPAFSLRIDAGQWVATVEHLYEREDRDDHRFLSAPVNGACGFPAAAAYDHSNFGEKPSEPLDFQVRAVLASDSAGLPAHLRVEEFTQCTTGVQLSTFGKLRRIDGSWTELILHVASSGRKDKDGIIELYVGRELIARAHGEFGYAGAGDPVQYFKIGPYRNNDVHWGSGIASIEVRNIRRGPRHEDVDPSFRMEHVS